MMGLVDKPGSPRSTGNVPSVQTPAEMQPDALMKQMHLPPGMQKPFMAVVVAGMKIMFSDQTHAQVMQQIEQPGPMPQKLGTGVAGLMAMLFKESNRSIAPQLLIPAGVVLMAHAADFLNKSGMAVSPQDFGAAMQIMVETLLRAFKVDPGKVTAAIAAKQGAAQ